MYYDAHQHLHDARLDLFRAGILEQLPALGISGGVVNGTCESDWPAVALLCEENPWLRPAFGLHPWRIAGRTMRWEETLTSFLDRYPRATIGETGLDCWVEGHDLADQMKVFVRQLAMARERNVVITVHCLKAHEPLRQLLHKHAAPPRGFLLHAYAGPNELVPFFLDQGAHFSFPPYFLHARKERQRTLFQSLPAERILVETDAPDLAPPDEWNRWPLTLPVDHLHKEPPLNHPANLITGYEALAAARGENIEQLAAAVAENWHRLFG